MNVCMSVACDLRQGVRLTVTVVNQSGVVVCQHDDGVRMLPDVKRRVWRPDPQGTRWLELPFVMEATDKLRLLIEARATTETAGPLAEDGRFIGGGELLLTEDVLAFSRVSVHCTLSECFTDVWPVIM